MRTGLIFFFEQSTGALWTTWLAAQGKSIGEEWNSDCDRLKAVAGFCKTCQP